MRADAPSFSLPLRSPNPNTTTSPSASTAHPSGAPEQAADVSTEEEALNEDLWAMDPDMRAEFETFIDLAWPIRIRPTPNEFKQR
jgi:hypothetical protein